MDTIEATSTLANLKRYISGGGVVDRKASEAINMAIRALEVTAGPDTVSRKQAIDALKEAFNPSITNFVKAKIAIENLPSAQPNVPDTNVGDTISRQAAIDAAKRVLGDRELTRTVQTALHILPSARPEIIRCKECGNRRYDGDGIPYCSIIDFGYGWNDDDYCSYAKKERLNGKEQ